MGNCSSTVEYPKGPSHAARQKRDPSLTEAVYSGCGRKGRYVLVINGKKLPRTLLAGSSREPGKKRGGGHFTFVVRSAGEGEKRLRRDSGFCCSGQGTKRERTEVTRIVALRRQKRTRLQVVVGTQSKREGGIINLWPSTRRERGITMRFLASVIHTIKKKKGGGRSSVPRRAHPIPPKKGKQNRCRNRSPSKMRVMSVRVTEAGHEQRGGGRTSGR